MSVNVAGSPGSDGNTRYNLNFGYTTEDGYIRNNGLTRYNIGLGGSTKLSNKFSFEPNWMKSLFLNTNLQPGRSLK